MSNIMHLEDRKDCVISVRGILATCVYNNALEKIGIIHDIGIERSNGRVSVIVLRVNGRLSIHRQSRSLSWKSLSYSTELGGYILDSD